MRDDPQFILREEGFDPAEASALLPLVYQDLRRRARLMMANESPNHTLNPTALVHEAYMRLTKSGHAQRWDGRRHFFAAAAEAMRRILVESARRKSSLKRGGSLRPCDLDPNQIAVDSHDQELLLVDEALDRLAGEDPQAAELVKLRCFAGLTMDEAAELLSIARSTAHRHWAYAKALLMIHLEQSISD